MTAAHPCPAAAVTLVDVAEMTPEERFACFGRHDLTLRGYLGGFLDGGMTAFPPTPGWLADDTSCCRPLLPLAGRPQDIVFLQVAFEPGGPRQSKIPDLAGVPSPDTSTIRGRPPAVKRTYPRQIHQGVSLAVL